MTFDPAAYQTTLLTDEGSFRAFPLAWTIQQTEGKQSVAVNVRFAIGQKWHPDYKVEGQTEPGAWSENYQPGFFVDGWFYIIKNDGTENDMAVRQLIEGLGWNGDVGAFEGDPPRSTVCIIRTGFELYEGKQRLKLQWLSANEDRPPVPGGLKPADSELVRSLQARFGGSFRSKAGGGGAPQGAPPTPPAAGFPGADTAAPTTGGDAAPAHSEPAAQSAPAAQAPAAPQAGGAPSAPSPQGGGAPAGPITDDEVPF
jgi:hypothetical protein